MISYIGKKYKFDVNAAKSIKESIDDLYNNDFTNNIYIQRDMKISDFEQIIKKIDKFLDNIVEIENGKEITRLETLEEAREYFGEDFIKNFENIFNEAAKNKIRIFLHGTFKEEAEQILKTGLAYHTTDLFDTAYDVPLTYEGIDYVKILNWPHREVKNLVMICVPEEVKTKGLFVRENNLDYSLNHVNKINKENFVITPDFIYGYIDVRKKEILLNDKYSNEHDYTNKIIDDNVDKIIYRESCNNIKYFKKIYEKELALSSDEKSDEIELEDHNITSVYLSGKLNELRPLFANLEEYYNGELNANQYKYYLSHIKNILNVLKKVEDHLLEDNEFTSFK